MSWVACWAGRSPVRRWTRSAIRDWVGRWPCSTGWRRLPPCWPCGGPADISGGHMSDPLLKPLLAGDRRALAKAITLIESTRADHRERADALLAAVLPQAGKSVRLGITGVPGVGK